MGRVQRVNNFACCLLAGGLSVFSASPLAADTSYVSVGGAYFDSGSETSSALKGLLKSIELGHEGNFIAPGRIGWNSNFRLNYSDDPSSCSYGVDVDQGLSGGMTAGVTAAKTVGFGKDEEAGKKTYKDYTMNRYGGRFSFWMRKNTLKIGLEGSQQSTSKESRDYQDVDGLRVRVASDVEGSTATVRWTHLTTPTTILLGNVSQTRITGRPAALSFGAEGRQYIPTLASAIHLAYDRYQDAGNVETTTDYGKISSNTYALRYHQKLPSDLILSSYTKWHFETEVPRASEVGVSERQHLSEVIALRWRLVEGSWTDDATEIGFYTGFFTRSEETARVGDEVYSDEAEDLLSQKDFVRMVGLQVRVVF